MWMKIALGAAFTAGAATLALAQGFDPNPANRYPAYAQPDAAMPYLGMPRGGVPGAVPTAPEASVQSKPAALRAGHSVQPRPSRRSRGAGG
jgi:hypothetical protein